MNELPRGWAEVELGKVCSRAKKWDPRKTPNVEFDYIDISSIDRQRVTAAKRLTGEEAPSRARQVVRAGDTILSTVRTYLVNTALVPQELDRATASTGFCVLRPTAAIDVKFLFYRAITSDFVNTLSTLQTGSNYPAVRDSDVFAQAIALPPLAEQRRIVGAIEEQLSRVDAADTALRRSRARAEQLRLAVLRQAVNGPWPTQRVADIAKVGSGATPKRGVDDYWVGGDVPWVTSGQLTKPFVEEPAGYITQKALRETNCRIWPAHTLLVAMYGEGKTRGHCSELLIDAATNQACAAISSIDPSVDRRYLKLFFAAEYEANRRLSAGGVQPNLSLSLIKEMRFRCPPGDQQEAVVRTVEGELAVVERLAGEAAKAMHRATGLRHSILATAFRGELVPQDPDDEPASVLLERTAAERAAAPKPPRKRREKASA